MLFTLFVLPVAIPVGVSIAILPAAVLGASNLGSAPGFTKFEDETAYGIGFGAGGNRADVRCFGQ